MGPTRRRPFKRDWREKYNLSRGTGLEEVLEETSGDNIVVVPYEQTKKKEVEELF